MGRALHLVSYDVRCPKRWRRVFGILRRRGEHRQLSVFLLRLDGVEVRKLSTALSAVIDPTQDSLLIARIDGTASGITELGQGGPMPGARVVVL